MKYAILRTKKLKEWGNICASLEHNFRERMTPNADENRTGLNIHIGGNSTAEVRAEIEKGLPEKYRADCVKCVEYLITASPEWFELADEREIKQYFDRLSGLKSDTGKIISSAFRYTMTKKHRTLWHTLFRLMNVEN